MFQLVAIPSHFMFIIGVLSWYAHLRQQMFVKLGNVDT